MLDINEMEIDSEDRLGIVSLNGTGKTTLLNIISGKIQPDQGLLRVYGSISYMDQEEGFSEGIMDKRLAGEFGVNDMYADYLSGGEKTRLKIAKSLGDFCNNKYSHICNTRVLPGYFYGKFKFNCLFYNIK